MKNLTIKAAVFSAILTLGLSSCSTTYKTMAEPNSKVLFNKADFTFSPQVTAEGKSVKVFGIDWIRLFSSTKVGSLDNSVSLANIPVVGNLISDRTGGLSLYKLMEENPGYDVVFYPQYKRKVMKPFLGLGFIYKRTTVETTARLAKINE